MFRAAGQIFLRVLVLVPALTSLGHAQAPLCDPQGATPLTLSRIEDDGTLTGAMGEHLRLTGLVWPDATEPARRLHLKATLEQAILNETLSFKPAAPPDRWGITPAYVFVAEKGQPSAFWLQAGLAERGLAPGWPELPPLCWSLLLAHEREARRAHLGYWAPRAQAARHRAIAQDPARHIGRRMVARWRVRSIRQSQILTYVNIVPFFRVGPSLGLTTKQVQALAKQGRPLADMAGHMVVARFLSGPTGLLRARLVQGEALSLDQD